VKQEIEAIGDKDLEQELVILTLLTKAAPKLPKDLYFERQASDNTCFIHALNMYHQSKYVDPEPFVKNYGKLVAKLVDAITAVKHAKISFYGPNVAVPDPKEYVVPHLTVI